jgi:hypothetical protein
MVLSVLGFLSSAVGVLILHRAWQRQIPKFRGAAISGAWLFVALAIYLWSLAHGAEFGVCFALIALALQSWSLITFTRDSRRRHNGEPAFKPKPLALASGIRALPMQSLLFVSAVPLAGLSAMLFTVVTTMLLPWDKVNLMALGIYAMPVVWGAAAYWAIADSKRWRPALTFILVSVIAALIIYR